MIAKYFKVPGARRVIRSTPAAPYLDSFALELERVQHQPETIRVDLLVAAHASSWAGRLGIAVAHFDETLIGRFEAHMVRCRCHWALRRRHAHAGWALRLFIEHLRRQTVIPKLPPRPEPPELGAFRDWLRRHRGSSEKTIHIYTYFLRDALEALGCDTRRFTAAKLRSYVLAQAHEKGRSSAMMIVRALRILGPKGSPAPTAAEVDYLLWSAGQGKPGLPPYHRTRTIYY